MAGTRLREGFSGESIYVIPRPVLAEARRHPLVRPLFPTDVGWFPTARYHYRDRPTGAVEDHLMMCVGGRGFVQVNGDTNELRPGQLLIIPRRVRHTYWAADDAPWSIYWMHFLGDDAEYYLGRIPGPGRPADIDQHTLDEAKRLFRDCLDALENGYSLPNLIYAAQSARHILSLLLFRNPALPLPQLKASRMLQLQAIMEFMHENVAGQVSLRQLAEQAGHSVSHFSEWFKTQTGQSPLTCFVQLKIRFACRLLDRTDRSIKAVAMDAGYSDPYYFSRVFKKAMGISPLKYRAIKKG
jgi:AraC-like DNA-binding protein